MKAYIKFDFLNMFLYQNDINEDDLVDVRWEDLTLWNYGDEVEVLKEFESERFSGGKGYVIYNPKTKASTSVAYHVIDFNE